MSRETMRTIALTSFVMVSLMATVASAQAAGGWTDDEATTEGEATLEAEAEAPAEAPPPEKAKPAADTKAKAEPAKTEKAADAKTDAKKDTPPDPKAEKNPTAHNHDGFYLRLSMGGGSVAARGDRYDADQKREDYDFEGDGFSTNIMIGGTPGSGIVLGGAYLGNSAMSRSDFGEDNQKMDAAFSYGMVGPFLDIYPNPKNGFHVGGALGPAVSVSYDEDENQQSIAAGFGAAAWIGYDFWVSDQWSLGGMLQVQGARVETPKSRRLEENDSPNHDRLGIGSASLMLTALYH